MRKKERVVTVRIRSGEKVTLRIEAEGVAVVTGDAAELAQELFDNSYHRLLSSKTLRGRRAFVRGEHYPKASPC